MIEFVTASHNEEVLKANLLQSKAILYSPPHIKWGYTNVPKAYNKAKTKGLVCYVHHDVCLPDSFDDDLAATLDKLPKDWAVLGVAGVNYVNGKKEFHGYVRDRGIDLGSPDNLPHEVETLDELLLITHGDFVFDENLDLHFYGADICMQAREQGRKCYAINAYCHHNSSLEPGYRSPEFHKCQKYFRNKWKKYLPIATCCAIVI